jgi:hypothetical protein
MKKAVFWDMAPCRYCINCVSHSSDVLSILRHSCHLVPGFLIHLLTRICCLGPRSLMPLLHSRPFQHLFPNVRPFWVSCTTLPWSYLLWSCPPWRATFVPWVISWLWTIPSVVYVFPGSKFPENVSLALCHCCTMGHLPAGSSQLPPGSTISSGHPAAWCWPLCNFFIVPKDFTQASSVGTSHCSTSDSMSSRFSSLLSRHTSVVTWQDIVSFQSFFMSSIQALTMDLISAWPDWIPSLNLRSSFPG